MAAGDATSADVPGKFDVVINGKGYVFADSVEPSLPFRTHRAIYDISPTFVERQNVGTSYGDDSQAFFLTASQNDWSGGEDQRFLKGGDAESVHRYWLGSNVDVSVPGQATIRPKVATLSLAAAVSNASGQIHGGFFAASSTNLYEISATGSITDRGAHGAGGLADAICTDGVYVYLSGGSCTKVRRYNTTTHAFADFGTNVPATALAFFANTLWGAGVLGTNISYYSTSGVPTAAFTWQDATGTGSATPKAIAPLGGKIAALVPSAFSPSGAEVWIGDTTGMSRLAEFPQLFSETTMIQADGILFIAGTESSATQGCRTVIYYISNGTLGRLWSSPNWLSGFGSAGVGIAKFQNGLLFTDVANSALRYYDLASGATSVVAAYTPSAANTYIATNDKCVLVTQAVSSAIILASDAAIATTASVSSSLIDFDNSLTKIFRGVQVDFTSATDGDGGSVDIAYQVDSVDGSYTTLKTGAVSGTEYALTGVSGHSVSVKITLNKGTSTLGPVLKRVYVRAAPALQQFKSGLYILDCTNTEGNPRQLRDESYHPLTGYDQVQNLLTAAKTTTPFSVTDKVNGTFTALVDLSDQEGWDVYEIHPDPSNLKKPGSYFVRIKLREV